MKNNKVILCQAIRTLGEIRGRKRLHKMLHITNSIGYSIGYSFDWANYRPYSNGIQVDLIFLRDQDIIIEREETHTNYKGYTYYPTPFCEEYINAFQQSDVPDLINILERLNNEDTNTLELWSSILFLKEQGEVGEQLVAFLNHLKPQFSPESIRTAMNDVEQLKIGVE